MKSIFVSLATALISLSASAATYQLDAAHTTVGFSVKHLMISNVKGQFDKFGGSFDFDSAKGTLKDVKVTVETASINTGNKDRDDHLRTGDFFEAAKHPQITFKSTKVEMSKDGKTAKVTGDLTLRGKTKSIVMDFTNNGEAEANGTKKVGFSGTGKILRSEFGMSWNKALDKGGVAVGDEITILIEGEGNLASAKK